MSASKLVKPSVDYKDGYLEALREFHAEGRYEFLDDKELEENFSAFIGDINAGKKHLHKPYENWVEPVPETILWLVKDHEYLGSINIRHRLNWHLEKWGGHINFVIRPTKRGKGFGKKILRKGIVYACHLGVERALMTVDPDNKAGITIVEKCGGVYADTMPETEKFPERHRYWLDCR